MKVSRKVWGIFGYGSIIILIASILTHFAVGVIIGIGALIISFIGLERKTSIPISTVQKSHNKSLEPEESILP